MDNSWVKETMELLEDWENQKQSLQNKVEQLQNELMDLEDSILAGHALIRAYMEKHNVSPAPVRTEYADFFKNKSYPEALIGWTKLNQGYLKVADITDAMFAVGFSLDRRAIQANIYSALRRMKDSFKKISRGEYRFVNHINRDDKPSGLRQAVKALKEANPQMTKKEALNHLIKNGFDFKGKKPVNALNITWAYLGYSKEGKQQSLLNT